MKSKPQLSLVARETLFVIGSSILVDLTIGGFALGISLILLARTAEPRRRMAIAAAAFHPIASLCLFYSLAIHMHRRLGGWPRMIGDQGFPRDLVMHADLTYFTFGSLLLGCIFVWPVAVLLCVCVPRMRPGLRYLGIYALTCGAAFGAMLLAPDPFLDWWWD